MYRDTLNINSDLERIVDIYNETTGRNRTVSNHRWEWFASPYQNRSYVITKSDGSIIGHHGILMVEFNYQNSVIKIGKTENSVAKKGYGPVYPRNEIAMYKEYSKKYDILMTTAARGVTKKIREKLGYTFFAKGIVYFSIVDFSILTSKFKSGFVKNIIKLIAQPANAFIISRKTIEDTFYKVKKLEEADLKNLSEFYYQVKDDFGISQLRTIHFLKYRFIDNPYSNFYLVNFYNDDVFIGYVIYQIYDDKLLVEDVLVFKEYSISDALSKIFNYVKKNKLAKIIIFSTLENSLLDSGYKGFFRKKGGDKASCVMVNKLESQTLSNEFTVENFYFTRLTNEGVI
jgi:hypothetical protein